MKHIPIKSNFVYPEITEEHYVFGSGQLAGKILRENGDWRDYAPEGELQKRNGIESSSCFVHGVQHGYSTLIEEEYDIKDLNFAERFNLIFANPTPNGGSPVDAAQSIRRYGMIPDSMLPFSSEITSWDDFNSFKGGDEKSCMTVGRIWRQRWEPRYDIVVTRGMSIADKYAKLKDALKYSPIPVSVCAWYQDDKGNYIKPKGYSDNHLVTLLHIDEQGCPYVFDTYEPFIKKLAPYYDFDFGMRLSISMLPVEKKVGFWEQILILIKGLFDHS